MALERRSLETPGLQSRGQSFVKEGKGSLKEPPADDLGENSRERQPRRDGGLLALATKQTDIHTQFGSVLSGNLLAWRGVQVPPWPAGVSPGQKLKVLPTNSKQKREGAEKRSGKHQVEGKGLNFFAKAGTALQATRTSALKSDWPGSMRGRFKKILQKQNLQKRSQRQVRDHERKKQSKPPFPRGRFQGSLTLQVYSASVCLCTAL